MTEKNTFTLSLLNWKIRFKNSGVYIEPPRPGASRRRYDGRHLSIPKARRDGPDRGTHCIHLGSGFGRRKVRYGFRERTMELMRLPAGHKPWPGAWKLKPEDLLPLAELTQQFAREVLQKDMLIGPAEEVLRDVLFIHMPLASRMKEFVDVMLQCDGNKMTAFSNFEALDQLVRATPFQESIHVRDRGIDVVHEACDAIKMNSVMCFGYRSREPLEPGDVTTHARDLQEFLDNEELRDDLDNIESFEAVYLVYTRLPEGREVWQLAPAANLDRANIQAWWRPRIAPWVVRLIRNAVEGLGVPYDLSELEKEILAS